MDKKDTKKTLTISSNFKKKIDSSNFNTSGKKSFSVEKKKPFKGNKISSRSSGQAGQHAMPETKKKHINTHTNNLINLYILTSFYYSIMCN